MCLVSCLQLKACASGTMIGGAGNPKFIPRPGFAGGRFLQSRRSNELYRLCHSSTHKAGGSERRWGHDGRGKMHRDLHCFLAVGSVIGCW